jgi:hypothetical protein
LTSRRIGFLARGSAFLPAAAFFDDVVFFFVAMLPP